MYTTGENSHTLNKAVLQLGTKVSLSELMIYINVNSTVNSTRLGDYIR